MVSHRVPGQAARPLHGSPEHDAQRSTQPAELTARAEARLATLLFNGGDAGERLGVC